MHGKRFLEKFRSKPENAAKATFEVVTPPKRWQRVSTTVPREWEVRLKRATRVSTYHLALELLYRQWRGARDKFTPKGAPIIVSSELAAAACISARSARNALEELERLGLIEVVRSSRRSPRATLLHIDTGTAKSET